MQIRQQIAESLLEVGAVNIRPEKPFQWASGWLSPIYCDNRLTLSYPSVRSLVRDAFINLIREKFPQTDIVAGVATAGIPQAAIIADHLGLPMIYVRSSPKGHGMENLIEGKAEPGKNVVLIEDLISTGGSSIKAGQAVAQAGMNVLAIVSVFTYGFPTAVEAFEQAGIRHESLSDYNALLDVARNKKMFTPAQEHNLASWRLSPSTWGK